MIRVENLSKSYHTQEGRVEAIDGISFEIGQGSFFTLLGPSGCGKTTTLRCIAGLERPDEGEIVIGERKVFSSKEKIFVPANRRDLGMVFQSYAIWPHMTVYRNVAYPLKARYWPRPQIRPKVHKALRLVGLDELSDRLATRLSGGQQQRVALARALVGEPQVLLLDEPLSNLDAKLRSQMRWELKELQSRLGTTTLYVTHDQVEALAISDEIALMNRGKIVQLGVPQEIYGNPVSEFAANFIGDANILKGQRIEGVGPNGRVRVRTPLGEIRATQRWRQEGAAGEVLVAFRPEEVSILTEERPSREDNVLRGEVEGFTYLGESTDFHIRVEGKSIQAKGEAGMRLGRGTPVFLHIPAQSCLVIAADEG